ncbi:N-6 DNA methylase [Streptomyces sp. MN03-5084-2B]|nr:N-6 DNA methylase [Streptomyces sp. MN03-5084-2B]
MSKVDAERLFREAWKAADILRGRLDASEYALALSGIFLLKWASDNPGRLTVPEWASWDSMVVNPEVSGRDLNYALTSLMKRNESTLGGIDFFDFEKKLGGREVRSLIDWMSHLSLRVDSLEFEDTVGQAFNKIVERFTLNLGKRGGELNTPRSVIELMVRLVGVGQGDALYDPFAGIGGMLIAGREHVTNYFGIRAPLYLYGQEINSSACSLARINLLLHGVQDASILRGDSLVDPLHVGADGARLLFDRVLSNPPFSLNYQSGAMRFPERMRYGVAPKRADLMNVQHVLASLKPDGLGVVVSPHGVLFRGGAEAEIRRNIVLDGRLIGVIGIGSNVFHGTSIPACILVLRGSGGSFGRERAEYVSGGGREGVFFIDAQREVVTGRMQNYLAPNHIEKIADVFLERRAVPGFSRLVSYGELSHNDFDLNIGRYIEANVEEESVISVRSVVLGGVPESIVKRSLPRFNRLGIVLEDLFDGFAGGYFQFPSSGFEENSLRFSALANSAERKLQSHGREWWNSVAPRMEEFIGSGLLVSFREGFKNSFRETLSDCMLDEFQLSGVFADWWAGSYDELRRLNQGMRGEIKSDEDIIEILGQRLLEQLKKVAAAERQALVDLYRSWGDRYATSLRGLGEKRAAGERRLEARLRSLGYPSPFLHD